MVDWCDHGRVREPPKGFRGEFLWTPGPAAIAAGVRIPSDRAADALTAIAVAGGTGRAPLAGIVVLGRWLGVKPGDSSWGVAGVDSRDAGFTVRMNGRLAIEVQRPSDAILTPGPYGDLFIIPSAHEVVVTENERPADWLPSVRGGRAHDARGLPSRWPARRAPGHRSPFAKGSPLPALMLSIWFARPLPADLAPQLG